MTVCAPETATAIEALLKLDKQKKLALAAKKRRCEIKERAESAEASALGINQFALTDNVATMMINRQQVPMVNRRIGRVGRPPRQYVMSTSTSTPEPAGQQRADTKPLLPRKPRQPRKPRPKTIKLELATLASTSANGSQQPADAVVDNAAPPLAAAQSMDTAVSANVAVALSMPNAEQQPMDIAASANVAQSYAVITVPAVDPMVNIEPTNASTTNGFPNEMSGEQQQVFGSHIDQSGRPEQTSPSTATTASTDKPPARPINRIVYLEPRSTALCSRLAFAPATVLPSPGHCQPFRPQTVLFPITHIAAADPPPPHMPLESTPPTTSAHSIITNRLAELLTRHHASPVAQAAGSSVPIQPKVTLTFAPISGTPELQLPPLQAAVGDAGVVSVNEAELMPPAPLAMFVSNNDPNGQTPFEASNNCAIRNPAEQLLPAEQDTTPLASNVIYTSPSLETNITGPRPLAVQRVAELQLGDIDMVDAHARNTSYTPTLGLPVAAFVEGIGDISESSEPPSLTHLLTATTECDTATTGDEMECSELSGMLTQFLYLCLLSRALN